MQALEGVAKTAMAFGEDMMPARIVTLTINPAVDLASQAASVQPGHKIRTFGERYDAGGGGINVARVISELGGETLALFASGGVTGRFIEEFLTTAKVPWQSVQVRRRLPDQRHGA